jgi:hypothetical protein
MLLIDFGLSMLALVAYLIWVMSPGSQHLENHLEFGNPTKLVRSDWAGYGCTSTGLFAVLCLIGWNITSTTMNQNTR